MGLIPSMLSFQILQKLNIEISRFGAVPNSLKIRYYTKASFRCPGIYLYQLVRTQPCIRARTDFRQSFSGNAFFMNSFNRLN